MKNTKEGSISAPVRHPLEFENPDFLNPKKLDDAIIEMLDHDGPVIFDCLVEKHENCFPMIPSGKAHNEMLMGDDKTEDAIDSTGAVMV